MSEVPVFSFRENLRHFSGIFYYVFKRGFCGCTHIHHAPYDFEYETDLLVLHNDRKNVFKINLHTN